MQLVLEVRMLLKGKTFVLGIPMNWKSPTYNVFQAAPLYQPNDEVETATFFQFPKPNVSKTNEKYQHHRESRVYATSMHE